MIDENAMLSVSYVFLLIAVGANAYITGISSALITSPVAPLRLRQYGHLNPSQNKRAKLRKYFVLIKAPSKDVEPFRGEYLCAKRLSYEGSSSSVSKTSPLFQLNLFRGDSHRQKRSNFFTLAASKFKNFDEMLDIYHDMTVLVTFSSRMCGPCKSMGKEMDHVRDVMEDDVKIFNVDTDRFPDLSSRYDVKELPCTLLFKNGNPIGRIQGVKTAKDLIRQIKKIT